MAVLIKVQDKRYIKAKLREQVAGLIEEGKSTEEIAGILGMNPYQIGAYRRHYEKSGRKDKKERFDEVLKEIKEGELIFPPREEDPNVTEAYFLAAELGYSHETIERSITDGYSNNLVSLIKNISEQQPLEEELIKESKLLAKFLIDRATKENQEKEFKDLIEHIYFSADKPLNPRHYALLQRARELKARNNYFTDGKPNNVLDNLERRLEREVMNNENALFAHLYLTQKTTELLKRNAIFTFNELLTYSEDELNMLEGWNEGNTKEIKGALSTVNLNLFYPKMDVSSESKKEEKNIEQSLVEN